MCLFDDQGTLSLLAGGQVVVRQRFTVCADEIEFDEVEGPGEFGPGLYKGCLEDNVLVFTRIRDRYADRVGALSFNWVREAGPS
ncbi:MAG: hypothetical protein JXB85_10310 [Anaerolineales bacterium]|nr:hypothetical protein [Anaerolineales bacterium]